MTHELTNQELLDRYVHAVKMLLPADKMDDIAAEIRSNLQSLVEDRATQLGRELSAVEMSAILKQHGHPMLVAGRYRDQTMRGLISPELFPFYWFTLRAILALWVTIRVIVAVFTLQGTATVSSVLLLFGRDILLAAFFIPSGVTLIFAVWEYLEHKFRYSERWKPESLPLVPRIPQPQSQQRPMVHVVGGVVWLVFWALALFVPAFFWVWGGRGVFSPSDTVYAMRLPLWLLAAFGISQSWLKYTRFATAEWRRFLVTAVVAAGLVLALLLLRGGDLLVAGPRWDPSQARSLATLNQMTAGVLVLACAFAVLLCLHELRRFARRFPGGQSSDKFNGHKVMY
jgi:hypothetical protein